MFSNQFAGVQGSGPAVVAEANSPGSSEVFQIVRKSDDPSRVRIQAPNGLFLQVYHLLFSPSKSYVWFIGTAHVYEDL